MSRWAVATLVKRRFRVLRLVDLRLRHVRRDLTVCGLILFG